jgi:hypothetical protein
MDTTSAVGVSVNESADHVVSADAETPRAVSMFEQIAENHRVIAEATKSNEALIKGLRKELKKICKRRRRAASGSPSNLMKPIALSDALCDFLEKPRGCKLTRGQVTSMVNTYASNNGLKKAGNGRVIVLNGPLGDLLGLPPGEEVQIFRVPTHLKIQNHYLKEEA